MPEYSIIPALHIEIILAYGSHGYCLNVLFHLTSNPSTLNIATLRSLSLNSTDWKNFIIKLHIIKLWSAQQRFSKNRKDCHDENIDKSSARLALWNTSFVNDNCKFVCTNS